MTTKRKGLASTWSGSSGTLTSILIWGGSTLVAQAAKRLMKIQWWFMALMGAVTLSVQASPFAYISSSQNVNIIDVATNQLVKQISLGSFKGGWTGAAVSSKARYGYAVSQDNSTITVFDTYTNTVVSTITNSNGPRVVAMNSAGTYAYVANENSPTLTVFDTTTNAVSTIELPYGNPEGLVADPTRNLLYVSYTYRTGTFPSTDYVTVINTTTNTVINSYAYSVIDAYGWGGALAISPDGNYLYLGDGSGGIYKFDFTPASPTYGTVVASTLYPGLTSGGCCAYVEGVGIDPAGKYLYVGTWNYANTGSFAVLNTSDLSTATTLTLLEPAPNSTIGVTGGGVTVDPSGKYVYVSDGNYPAPSPVQVLNALGPNTTLNQTIANTDGTGSMGHDIFINGLSVSGVQGTGSGTITPTSQYVLGGTTATFTITPATGYNVGTVTADNCGPVSLVSGTTYVTSAVTTASCTVTANFVLQQFAVTPSAGAHGSLSPSTVQTVDYGSSTSFAVTPAPGYQIASVSGCGGSLSGNLYTTGSITANCTVSATFSLLSYAVNGSSGVGGSVSCVPSSVGFNGSSSCTATAATGYTFTGFSGDCTGTTCSLTNIQSNKSVTGNFTQNPLSSVCIASPSSAPAGTAVTVTCSNVPTGSTVTIAGLSCGSVSEAGQAVCTGTAGTGTGEVSGNMSATITASGFTPEQALPVLFTLLPLGVAPIPTLGEYALWALMLILAGFGALQLRRRHS